MKAKWITFGEIEIEDRRYTFDVVIEAGRVEKHRKKPSRLYRHEFGHTPLSVDESIPWGGSRLRAGEDSRCGSQPVGHPSSAARSPTSIFSAASSWMPVIMALYDPPQAAGAFGRGTTVRTSVGAFICDRNYVVLDLSSALRRSREEPS